MKQRATNSHSFKYDTFFPRSKQLFIDLLRKKKEHTKVKKRKKKKIKWKKELIADCSMVTSYNVEMYEMMATENLILRTWTWNMKYTYVTSTFTGFETLYWLVCIDFGR